MQLILIIKSYFITSLTASTTASFVIPKYSNNCPPGAEAPKPFIPTNLPSKPMYLPQPKSAKASTPTLALTLSGRI